MIPTDPQTPVKWLRANQVHTLPTVYSVAEQLYALDHEDADPFPPLPVDSKACFDVCMRGLRAVEGWAGFNAEGAPVAWRNHGGPARPLRLDPDVQLHVLVVPPRTRRRRS